MAIFGLGDDVKNKKNTDEKKSDKNSDKAVEEKRQAKQDAETCEFC